MSTICTIGYEGVSQDDVIDELRAEGVTLVVDVRERSASRKAGFSKSALKGALNEAGIGYEHWRDLGTPKEIRQLLRVQGDWEAFSSAYGERLGQKQDVVERLASRIQSERSCLLCFENDASRCHRSLLAARLLELGAAASSMNLDPSGGNDRKHGGRGG